MGEGPTMWEQTAQHLTGEVERLRKIEELATALWCALDEWHAADEQPWAEQAQALWLALTASERAALERVGESD